jgi:hypothetical protein
MRTTFRLLAAALILAAIAPVAAAAKWLPVHSVWSENRPIYIKDGDTGQLYTPERGYASHNWQEGTGQAFSHAVGIIPSGDVYEFRMVSLSFSDSDSINGLWDIYRNGALVCNHCVGKAYGLSGAIGNYFKIYVGTPLAYAEKWHFSGYITNRFDY